jgi:hypothetical protein
LEVAIKLLGHWIDIIAAKPTENGCWSITTLDRTRLCAQDALDAAGKV